MSTLEDIGLRLLRELSVKPTREVLVELLAHGLQKEFGVKYGREEVETFLEVLRLFGTNSLACLLLWFKINNSIDVKIKLTKSGLFIEEAGVYDEGKWYAVVTVEERWSPALKGVRGAKKMSYAIKL